MTQCRIIFLTLVVIFISGVITGCGSRNAPMGEPKSVPANLGDVLQPVSFAEDTGTRFYDESDIWCWAKADDRDGDGYAEDDAKANRFEVSEKGPFTCPKDSVDFGGDCNDDDRTIHPYHVENPFNEIDDNCNDWVDELSFDYGFARTLATTDRLEIRVVLAETGLVAIRSDLYAQIDIRRLNASSFAMTGTTSMQSIFVDEDDPAAFFVRVGNLEPATVYGARIRLHVMEDSGGEPDGFRPVDGWSSWYYGVTSGESRLEQAQAQATALALFEWDESERGFTGYRGSVNPDGTRYTATPGEWWCSEYYAWVTGHWLRNMTGRDWVGSLLSYFRSYNARYYGSSIPGLGEHADYLAMDTNGDGTLNHSGMLLAVEDSAEGTFLWTVEGNVGNKTTVLRREFDTERFQLGKLRERQLKP